MPHGSGLGGVTNTVPTTTISTPVDTTQSNQVESSTALGDRPVREVNNEQQTISFRERLSNACTAFKEKAGEVWQGFKDGCVTGWNNFTQGVKDAPGVMWNGIKHITPGLESQSQRNDRINSDVRDITSSVDNMMTSYREDELSESAQTFLQHTQREYNSENVMCFVDAGKELYPDGRGSDSPDDRHGSMTEDATKLRAFTNKFVAIGSEFQLNLAYGNRMSAVNNMQAYENALLALSNNTDNKQTDTLKANVEQAHHNLSDSIEVCLREIISLNGDSTLRFAALDH